MVKILRKIFLVDFFASALQPKQASHLRFAKFLTIFSYMWLMLAVTITFSLVSSLLKKGEHVYLVQSLSWAAACALFFFLYRYTSKIIKSYDENEISKIAFLKFINPVAPIIYVTTVVLIILTILNIIMFIFMIIGTIIFFIGIIVTFGLLLLDDSYKMDNFISLPKKFFRMEEFVLENIVSFEVIAIFLILIYFLIPCVTSLIIVLQHYKKEERSIEGKE